MRPGGAIYIGRGDYPFTSRAWEEEYWGRIDQRFLQEGFPPEELRITTGTNPARTLGPDLDLPNYQPLEDGGQAHRGGIYPWRSSLPPAIPPGQICLWMANQQVLFTADHVLFDITPNITMWPNLPNALGRYLESLTRIGTYPARLALPRPPAHGGFGPPDSGPSGPPPAAGGGDAGHCPGRGGGLNAYQVASRMTWDIRADSWADFPLNQKWFATERPWPIWNTWRRRGPLYAPWTRRAWPAIPPSKTRGEPPARLHTAPGALLERRGRGPAQDVPGPCGGKRGFGG